MNEQNFTKFDQIHIAGHSLGAHISGIAGKLVSRGKIQSIVAMDPAAFLFTSSSDSDRFAADDAVYTEAIITNGATLGFFEPIAQGSLVNFINIYIQLFRNSSLKQLSTRITANINQIVVTTPLALVLIQDHSS